MPTNALKGDHIGSPVGDPGGKYPLEDKDLPNAGMRLPTKEGHLKKAIRPLALAPCPTTPLALLSEIGTDHKKRR